MCAVRARSACLGFRGIRDSWKSPGLDGQGAKGRFLAGEGVRLHAATSFSPGVFFPAPGLKSAFFLRSGKGRIWSPRLEFFLESGKWLKFRSQNRAVEAKFGRFWGLNWPTLGLFRPGLVIFDQNDQNWSFWAGPGSFLAGIWDQARSWLDLAF